MGRTPHPERDQAKADWETTYGAPPPAYLSVRIMRKAVLFEQQCKEYGGMSAQTRTTLRQALRTNTASSNVSPSLSSGAQLLREWNGRRYCVEVVDDGFVMEGQRYRSLTAIARKITGTPWSGPRFFGLARAKGGRA